MSLIDFVISTMSNYFLQNESIIKKNECRIMMSFISLPNPSNKEDDSEDAGAMNESLLRNGIQLKSKTLKNSKNFFFC